MTPSLLTTDQTSVFSNPAVLQQPATAHSDKARELPQAFLAVAYARLTVFNRVTKLI
jgi:hypothetical protein